MGHKLWLRLRERPGDEQSWRDFWIVTIAVLLPFSMVLAAFDAPLLSITKAILYAGGVAWAVVVYKTLVRLGLIESRKTR